MRRLAQGGAIDRARTLEVTFDGEPLAAHPGDTLASALLAAGRGTVARSVVQGRPRGVVAAGMEEPNAFVQLEAPYAEPMVAATRVEAVDGLRASSLAGVGRLPGPDGARHDKRYAHCELVVVGAGRAGREAAGEALRSGAGRVIVADDRADAAAPEGARVLARTTALGLYDGNLVLLLERLGGGETRLWHVRARAVCLATGCHERPLVFRGNDRPGVMLAGAVRRYLERQAVAPERCVVFCNNDRAHATARALEDAGVAVTLVDVRAGEAVVDTEADGAGALAAVQVASLDEPARTRRIACDVLAVSGGRDPVLDLWKHRGGRTRWDARAACFVPDGDVAGVTVAGSAAGPDDAVAPCWAVPAPDGSWDRHYVDLHRDVTAADIRRAVGAGLDSIEHVKRYTLVGTGADQGRTAKVNAAALAAGLLGRDVGAVGTTTARPPFQPASFAALAGRASGARFDPVRTTPIHDWHVRRGALFEDVGQWKRPWYYPREGEDMDAAVLRECAAAREGVALMDASTLGKIDVQGPDAAELLNRLYTNAYDTLRVGRCRYGVLLTADGMVFDDGVVMRLAEDRFLATTTTGNAAAVLDWMEEWLQTEWPDLRVHLTSVTEQLATVAVVGPRSRDVVAALAPREDVSAEALPFMAWRDAEVAGLRARVARVSFSGELAFELSVPGYDGLALWEAAFAAGEPFGIAPYGTETMHVLRAEKGFIIVGQDTDGTVTPIDLGMDWIVSKAKDFVGKRSLRRADSARPDRKQLVGLLPLDPDMRLPEGGQIVADGDGDGGGRVPMLGHVTSSYRSAALGRAFALALLERGRERAGETLFVPVGGVRAPVTVVEPVFYDPEGRRRDG